MERDFGNYLLDPKSLYFYLSYVRDRLGRKSVRTFISCDDYSRSIECDVCSQKITQRRRMLLLGDYYNFFGIYFNGRWRPVCEHCYGVSIYGVPELNTIQKIKENKLALSKRNLFVSKLKKARWLLKQVNQVGPFIEEDWEKKVEKKPKSIRVVTFLPTEQVVLSQKIET